VRCTSWWYLCQERYATRLRVGRRARVDVLRLGEQQRCHHVPRTAQQPAAYTGRHDSKDGNSFEAAILMSPTTSTQTSPPSTSTPTLVIQAALRAHTQGRAHTRQQHTGRKDSTYDNARGRAPPCTRVTYRSTPALNAIESVHVHVCVPLNQILPLVRQAPLRRAQWYCGRQRRRRADPRGARGCPRGLGTPRSAREAATLLPPNYH